MLDQLSKNITRCGLSNSTLNYLRVSAASTPDHSHPPLQTLFDLGLDKVQAEPGGLGLCLGTSTTVLALASTRV